MAYDEELSEKVDEDEGVSVVSMRDLRDGFEFGRLGPHVCSTISRNLAGVGLGHAPEDLPEDQNQDVLVYRRGSEVESIILAVTHPSRSGAETLRTLGQNSPADVLDRIRALVCE
jgi:hypothetical protein